MINLINGILTKKECINLVKKFEFEKRTNPSFDKIEDTGNSYGFRPSYAFNTYLDRLKSRILEINPEIKDLTNVNTYVREYRNGSYLEKHVDRNDISVTMSICLESNIKKEWPLCAKINGREYCYNTNVGDGVVLFDADKIPHWRNKLICDQEDRVVQFFLHWIPIKYEVKKSKTII